MTKPATLLDLIPPESRADYLMGGGEFLKFRIASAIQSAVSEFYPDGPVEQAASAVVDFARERIAKIDGEIAKLEAERDEWRARAAQYEGIASAIPETSRPPHTC